MDMLTKAIFFATKAHEGQMRKMTNTPYILHPIEVASIIATITDDQDIMAAGVLHDVIEDCGVDPAVIKELFGPRVSALVQSDSEDRLDPRPASESIWSAEPTTLTNYAWAAKTHSRRCLG